MAQLFSAYREEPARHISAEKNGGIARQLADQVVDNVRYNPEGPELYQIQVCHAGVTAIRYDLAAALTAALGVVGGVVGANPISATAAVLTCLIALRGLRQRVPDVEACVLLELKRIGGRCSLGELSEAVRKQLPSASDQDVRERLSDLIHLGAASLVGNIASLEESVILRYAPLE